MLNANQFQYSQKLYSEEFIALIKYFIYCYQEMLKNPLSSNKEDTIRNYYIQNYLRNNTFQSKFELDYLYFNIGCETIDEVSFASKGRTDICIQNIKESLNSISIPKEEIYYTFECKRLDGNSTLNKQYIDEGIDRFVIGKYSDKMPLAGMIGFVVTNVDISKCVKSLNKALENHENIKTNTLLTFKKFLEDFEYSYHSNHKKNHGLSNINICHLMLKLV